MSELLELTIDGIAQGGDGVGRIEGLVVFVGGALPGERALVRILERRPSYLRGEIAELLDPAPERVAPLVAPGDHAPWQHIDYAAQLRFKETILREQLAKFIGPAELPLAPIIAAPAPWGYRNSARLHAAGGALGYHAAGTQRVVDQPDDPLLLPALGAALAELRRLPFAGLIDGVTLRASAAYGYLVAQIDPAVAAGLGELEALATAWAAGVPALAGVAAEPNGALVGADTIHDELGGVIFSLSPSSFFQVNLPQAERMLAVVRAGLAPAGGRLLDAYSGAGSFALPLAAGYEEVVAVESYPPAAADGVRSAELGGIANVRFVTAPAERAVGELAGPFDAAVLDPPRRGCHPALVAALVAHAPARVAYISCHPGLIGRDLAPLLAAGYTIELVQPVDLFPQTPHIETVVILARAG